MRIHDAILGLAIFIGGIIICLHASTFPSQTDGSPGPGLFPMTLSIVFSLAGAVLFLQSFKSLGLHNIISGKMADKRGLVNIALVLLCIAFYAFAAEFAGFLITMFVILLTLMLMLKTKPVKAVIVAATADTVIYLIFAKGLLVPLPTGLIGF